MDDLGEPDDFYSPLSPRIVIFDALLADLETSTSLLSKRPLEVQEDSEPRSRDAGTARSPDLHNSRPNAGNANPLQPPPPAYTPPQTVKDAQTSAQVRQGDKDHLYSTVCKTKPSPSEGKRIGSGLCELDRLLQELNRADLSSMDEILAQFPPGRPTETPSVTQDPIKDIGHGNVVQETTIKKTAGQGSEMGTGSDHEPVISHTVPPQSSATSATMELDKLMASLSDFKIHSTPPPQPAAQTQTSAVSGGPAETGGSEGEDRNLDDMLGKLHSNLLLQGVHPMSKGGCAACRKPIVGQMVTALGQTWHPEHFVCHHCQHEIGGSNFFEKEGFPYCEHDYWDLFSPRCAGCHQAIKDKMVTALDQNWHPEHFHCVQCGSLFGEDGFHERDGKAYCRQDFYELFASRCHGCSKAIMENYISALNVLWHPECFVCRDCYTPFVNGSFFEHSGEPLCETHYHRRRGSLCLACQTPIAGRCITALDSRFHPEHFVCVFCLKHLTKGTFREHGAKPYCHVCFTKLFG